MAHRRTTNRKLDRKIFRRTAVKSKKINIDPKIYRGGIRL
uniref:DNA binding protein n=1 Tax=Dulem virus 119 TaxID=3145596 RepID=A0AAU8B3S0_9VIRU